MLIGGIGQSFSTLLETANREGGLSMSLVCNESGLLLAAAGVGVDEEQLAGLTSLFDDIVVRAQRDIGMPSVDEVTMMDPRWGRCVIRPLATEAADRHFLVVCLPSGRTWRRTTNKLKRDLQRLFDGARGA